MKKVNASTVSTGTMSPKIQTDFIVRKSAICVRDTVKIQESVFHAIWATT